MTGNEGGLAQGSSRPQDRSSLPLIFATIFREEGKTGVHTHVRQLRQRLEAGGTPTTIITPFSWGRLLTYPVFGPRPLLARCSGPTSVVWYRHWHELFLRNALRRYLAGVGDCVVYAQGPLEARAAMQARQGPHQRVVMAVHFRASQADEYAEPGREIKRGGIVFRRIRQVERKVIPALDGIVYVSQWAQDVLLEWLPEAAVVPSAVIHNFVTPSPTVSGGQPIADLVTTGKLEFRKNHHFLLEVLAEAKRAGRALTLDVFGDGPSRKELERLTVSLELEGQVRFRGFRCDVRDFLPRYRAYVHAASAECLPLAIIEAMAAGLPIVAGAIAGISELCDEGVEARFWPLDDPAQAAAILLQLLESEPTRLKTAIAARERFHRDFDADHLAPRLRSFLLGMPTALSEFRPAARRKVRRRM